MLSTEPNSVKRDCNQEWILKTARHSQSEHPHDRSTSQKPNTVSDGRRQQRNQRAFHDADRFLIYFNEAPQQKRANKKLPDIGSGGIKPHHESHHHDHDVNK